MEKEPIWMKTLDIHALPGTKVQVVVNEEGEIWNGNDGDKETIQKYLEVGKQYTVESIRINDWSSDVVLEEITERWPTGVRIYFNSCNLVETSKIK